MFTTGEAARLLGVKPTMLLRWIKAGWIKSSKAPTKKAARYLIYKQDLLEMAKKMKLPSKIVQAVEKA